MNIYLVSCYRHFLKEHRLVLLCDNSVKSLWCVCFCAAESDVSSSGCEQWQKVHRSFMFYPVCRLMNQSFVVSQSSNHRYFMWRQCKLSNWALWWLNPEGSCYLSCRTSCCEALLMSVAWACSEPPVISILRPFISTQTLCSVFTNHTLTCLCCIGQYNDCTLQYNLLCTHSTTHHCISVLEVLYKYAEATTT